MTKKTPRRSLPRMGRPFEGIQLLLDLVAKHHPTKSNLDKLVEERRDNYSPRLTYLTSGKGDDVLYFCHKQLGLFSIENNRFELSDMGRDLYHRLHTPEFGLHLFMHLIERSKTYFTFFYQVYEALEMRAQSGQFELSATVFNSLLLEKSNKHSSKEIRDLLFGCGAVREQEGKIIIMPSFFSVDLQQKQLERLLAATVEILKKEGRQIYPELVAKLQPIYSSMDWHQLEEDFRSKLILSRTRASEYVDGVQGNQKRI